MDFNAVSAAPAQPEKSHLTFGVFTCQCGCGLGKVLVFLRSLAVCMPVLKALLQSTSNSTRITVADPL